MDREALGLQLLICYLSSVESSLLGRVEVIDAELHRLVAHRTTGVKPEIGWYFRAVSFWCP